MIASDHAHCSDRKCEKKEIVGTGGRMKQKISDFYFMGRYVERGGNDEDMLKHKIGLANSYKSNISRSSRESCYLYHIEEMWQQFGSSFASSAVILFTTSAFLSFCKSQKEVVFQRDPICPLNCGTCSVLSALLTHAARAQYLAIYMGF